MTSHLLFQDSRARPARKTLLPPDFEPNSYTVICARGKDAFNSVGNRRFRVLVDCHLEQYSMSLSKAEKSLIVSEIVETIRNAGGCFARFENGTWYEVGDRIAREKVGAQFRDCLHMQYRSSTKAKTARRRANRKAEKKVKNLAYDEDDDDCNTVATECTDGSFDDIDIDPLSLIPEGASRDSFTELGRFIDFDESDASTTFAV